MKKSNWLIEGELWNCGIVELWNCGIVELWNFPKGMVI
jgi:hypothetical protein